MLHNLRQFIDALETEGELHRVSISVSPRLEVTEIADRHSKSPACVVSEYAQQFDPDHYDRGGRALLFEKVEGSDFRLAINLYGSYHRTELALGCAERGGFAAIAERIAAISKPQPPRSLREMLRKARQFLPLLRIAPKLKWRGSCQEVVRLTERGEVDLTRLPIIKCWPHDGDPRAVGYDVSPEQAGTAAGQGRYITFAGMHTIHADDRDDPRPASHNIGMYRAQLLDATRLAMHWHVHHDGAAHWRSWKKLGRPMPIAIALGGEAVLPYAATAPLPPGISELLMAGFLNQGGIPLVRCKTVPLRVPANSEIVIEGWASTECGEIGYDPARDGPLGKGAVFEGPFGDHTGFYSMPDRYPIVNVSAITHRHDAIYPTTIVGLPPQEDYYLGKATERIFLPLLQTLIPDIVDYHLPMFGCFHNCAFIQIRKAYPLQARRVMHAIWGAGQMAWTKMIIVVDDGVDVHDELAVLRMMMQQTHFGRDIERVNGPLDILDHAAPRLGAGTKIGIDATYCWPGEEVNGVRHDAPIRLESELFDCERRRADIDLPYVQACASPRWSGGRAVFVSIDKTEAGQGACVIDRLWSRQAIGGDLVVVVDARVSLDDWRSAFFELCANCDPGRDMHFDEKRGRIGFDATAKLAGDERLGQPVRPFPPIIAMDAATRSRIDANPRAFGLASDSSISSDVHATFGEGVSDDSPGSSKAHDHSPTA